VSRRRGGGGWLGPTLFLACRGPAALAGPTALAGLAGPACTGPALLQASPELEVDGNLDCVLAGPGRRVGT
jgi:hypothetical protein